MAGLGKRMSSGQKVETVDREATVLELAKAGLTFREIGDHLDMSAAGAHKAFQRGLRKTLQPAADEYRAIHLARLETIFRTHYPAMRRSDFAATDRCLKALASIAALLGLNEPARINITTLVAEAAEQFGLTDDERVTLINDVQAFIEAQKAVAS